MGRGRRRLPAVARDGDARLPRLVDLGSAVRGRAARVLHLRLFLFTPWSVRQPPPTGDASGADGGRAHRPAHETWVLDDGARLQVERMRCELGARYLARGDNHGAKAGNLNNAIERPRATSSRSLTPTTSPRRASSSGRFRTSATRRSRSSRRRRTSTTSTRSSTPATSARMPTRSSCGASASRRSSIAWSSRARTAGTPPSGAARTPSCARGAALGRRDRYRTITEDIQHEPPPAPRRLAHGLPERGAGAWPGREAIGAYTLQRRRWGAGAMQLIRRETSSPSRG